MVRSLLVRCLCRARLGERHRLKGHHLLQFLGTSWHKAHFESMAWRVKQFGKDWQITGTTIGIGLGLGLMMVQSNSWNRSVTALRSNCSEFIHAMPVMYGSEDLQSLHFCIFSKPAIHAIQRQFHLPWGSFSMLYGITWWRLELGGSACGVERRKRYFGKE